MFFVQYLFFSAENYLYFSYYSIKKHVVEKLENYFVDTPLIWSHDSAVILLFFFVSLSPFWDLGNSTLGDATGHMQSYEESHFRVRN